MVDKDKIRTEISKKITNLKNNGCNVEGFYYGFKDYDNLLAFNKNTNLAIDEKQEEEQEEKEDAIKWIPENGYIKLYPKGLANIAEKLSGTEMLVTLKLVGYISYESGLLKRNRETPLTMTDVEKITGLSKKTVIKCMANLVRKKVLFRGRTGIAENDPYQFYVNPYIFFRGRFINKTLVDMFKDYRK